MNFRRFGGASVLFDLDHRGGDFFSSNVKDQKRSSGLVTQLHTKYVGRLLTHSGPENLKKSRSKKLMKSNNSISRKKLHFLQFQKWTNINF